MARKSHLGSTDLGDGDLAERELAGDAQWKLIQKNTFTRWTNEHLKTVNKHVNDLESDLSDGLRLLALVEVLSGKRFLRWNKQPKFRTMKLENVTLALKFLEDVEGIRIVNIGMKSLWNMWHYKYIMNILVNSILTINIKITC